MVDGALDTPTEAGAFGSDNFLSCAPCATRGVTSNQEGRRLSLCALRSLVAKIYAPKNLSHKGSQGASKKVFYAIHVILRG